MPSITSTMIRTGAHSLAAGASPMTTTAHYLAGIYCPIPGKTITKIGAYCSTATGSPVVDVRLETLNSSGFPSGNLVATNTALASQSVVAATWYNWTLTASYAVPTNANTLLAATIRYVSGTSSNFNLRNSINALAIPRNSQNTGTETVNATTPMICIEYSDGTVHLSCPVIAQGSAAYNSTSNPDEYGNRFTAPMNCVVVGISEFSRMNAAAASARYRILDASLNVLTNDSELTTVQNHKATTSATENTTIYLSTPVYLVAGATYYITRAAVSSDANSVYQSSVTFATTAHKEAFYSDFSLCTRQNDSGAFTVDTTKVEMMSPIISTSFSNKIVVS